MCHFPNPVWSRRGDGSLCRSGGKGEGRLKEPRKANFFELGQLHPFSYTLPAQMCTSGMYTLLTVALDPLLSILSRVISDLCVLSATAEKLQQKELGWLVNGSTMTSFIWPGLSESSRTESRRGLLVPGPRSCEQLISL